MSWSLSHQPLREPELLDLFFLSVGKALYLASAFEYKCQYVLRMAKIATHFERADKASGLMEFIKTIEDKGLNTTINALKIFPSFTSENIANLNRAREARNYIAHESTDIGHLSSASAQTINEKLFRLRKELEPLVIGDNLVSRWIYEISEGVHAPNDIQAVYPRWIFHWVFGDEDYN